MEKTYKKLDEEEIMSITEMKRDEYRNLKAQSWMSPSIRNYEKDVNKNIRLQKLECKACHYLDDNKYYSQVFTQTNCSICGSRMTFPTSKTDRVCHDCSEKHGICRHCGGKID